MAGEHMAGKDEKIELMEESDRSVFIVAAAMLEERLQNLLSEEFTKNKIQGKITKQLFDLNGPLSNFSSKTSICYAFGLISKEIFDDMTTIRRLRNESAHSYSKVDFLDEEIGRRILSLNCCSKIAEEWNVKRYAYAKQRDGEGLSVDEHEMRRLGFVKFNKSIFCVGIQQLHIMISKWSIMEKLQCSEDEIEEKVNSLRCKNGQL